MRRLAAPLLALTLAACGSADIRVYAPLQGATHALPVDVLLAPVDGDAAYLSNDILLRNANESALRPYTDGHWQAAPVDLLRDRLHAASNGTLTLLGKKPQRAHCALNVRIAAYEYVLDNKERYGEVRIDYALVHLNSNVRLTAKSLDIKTPSQGADAQSAAEAIGTSSREAVQRILDDLNKTLGASEKLERCSNP